jgi:hypothetical protein
MIMKAWTDIPTKTPKRRMMIKKSNLSRIPMGLWCASRGSTSFIPKRARKREVREPDGCPPEYAVSKKQDRISSFGQT